MTNPQENLKELRSIIIKAVPSIVELKFGCEVELKGYLGETIYIDEVTTNGGIHFNPTTTYFLKNEAEGSVTCEKIDKIIGRPITLADVLLALQKKLGRKVLNDEVTGQRVKKFREDILFIVGLWNLSESENSLDWHAKHRPETITYLLNILR